MVTTTRLSFAAAFVAGLLASGISSCLAEELTVNADQSQIISLSRPASTVVVGNPSIADVTIQGSQLFVHGRLFGKTNIIALDDSGNLIGKYDVNVGVDDTYNVVMFRPIPGKPTLFVKESFTCKFDCERVFHVGDDGGSSKDMNEQQKNKLSLAEGRKPGENGGDGAESAPPQ
jgi:Pilus formation protein N terminal region